MTLRLLTTAAVIAFAVPALALAQPDDHHGGGEHHEGGASHGGAPQGGGPQGHAGAQPSHAGPQTQNAPTSHSQGLVFPGGQGGNNPQRPTFPGGQGGYRPQPGQPGYHGQGPSFPGGQGGYRPQPGQPGYHPQGQNFPGGQGGYRGGYHGAQPGASRRAGGQAFYYGGRNFYRFRAEPYRYPRGYYAGRRWGRGEWLPPVFISPGYFINDWYDFDLSQPYDGYQWIRVGDDAVLVSLQTGQIVDEVPGVYYDY